MRFLARDAAVMPGDFDSLPSGHRAAVVIDDAHDRGGLAGLIRGIRRARPGAKVILSLRPQGLARLEPIFASWPASVGDSRMAP